MNYCRAILLSLILLGVISSGSFGQSTERITLKIDFLSQNESVEQLIRDFDKTEKSPRLLVYANGKYVGIAPGNFGLELDKAGTIIEVGLPEFQAAPLYSFVISDASISNNISYVNYSEMEYSINNISENNYIFDSTIVFAKKTSGKIEIY